VSLEHRIACISVLQCVAVCCSVLQCVAMALQVLPPDLEVLPPASTRCGPIRNFEGGSSIFLGGPPLFTSKCGG